MNLTILHVLQEPVDIVTAKLLRLEIIICFLKPWSLLSTSSVSTKDICSNILPLTHDSLAMTLIPVRRTNVRSMGFYIYVNSSIVNKVSKSFICSKNYPYVCNEFLYHSQSYKAFQMKNLSELIPVKVLIHFFFLAQFLVFTLYLVKETTGLPNCCWVHSVCIINIIWVLQVCTESWNLRL